MGTKDVTIKLRLSREQLEMLDRYSAAINESRSATIRTLINYAYENALFIRPEAVKNQQMIAHERLIENMIDYYDSQVEQKFSEYCLYKKERRKIIQTCPKDEIESALKQHENENELLLNFCNVELQRFYDALEMDFDEIDCPIEDEE